MGCGASRLNFRSRAGKSPIVPSDRPTPRAATAIVPVEKLTKKENEAERPDTYGNDGGARPPLPANDRNTTEVEVEVELTPIESGASNEPRSQDKAVVSDDAKPLTTAVEKSDAESEQEAEEKEKSTTTEIPELAVEEEHKEEAEEKEIEEKSLMPQQKETKTEQASKEKTELVEDEAKSAKTEEKYLEPTEVHKSAEAGEQAKEGRKENEVKVEEDQIPVALEAEQRQEGSTGVEEGNSRQVEEPDQMNETLKPTSTLTAENKPPSEEVTQPTGESTNKEEGRDKEKDESTKNTELTAAEAEIIAKAETEDVKKEDATSKTESRPVSSENPPPSETPVEVKPSEEVDGDKYLAPKEESKTAVVDDAPPQNDTAASNPVNYEEKKKEEAVNLEAKATEKTETKTEEPRPSADLNQNTTAEVLPPTPEEVSAAKQVTEKQQPQEETPEAATTEEEGEGKCAGDSTGNAAEEAKRDIVTEGAIKEDAENKGTPANDTRNEAGAEVKSVQQTNKSATLPEETLPAKLAEEEKLNQQSKSCANSQVDLSQNAPGNTRSRASLDKVEDVQIKEKIEIDHSTGQSQASLVEAVEKTELPTPSSSSTATT